MLAALLLFGWFPWAIFLVASLIIIIASEFDRNGLATFSMVAGAAILVAVTKTNPLPWIQSHLLVSILGVVGYFVVGTVWGFIKWYFFNLNIRDAVLEYRATDPTPHWSNEPKFPPKLVDHKGRIIGWMTYWPWNMVAWVLREPVRRAWKFIYARVSKGFEKITNNVFKSVAVLCKCCSNKDDKCKCCEGARFGAPCKCCEDKCKCCNPSTK